MEPAGSESHDLEFPGDWRSKTSHSFLEEFSKRSVCISRAPSFSDAALRYDPRWPELRLQPDSRLISQEKLSLEVKHIYATLTRVEDLCRFVHGEQVPQQWWQSYRNSVLEVELFKTDQLIFLHQMLVGNRPLRIREQVVSSGGLEGQQWQDLIALHRTLLYEHYDLIVASLHRSTSPKCHRLPATYSTPARMWKHGIHPFLELLCRRLPESVDYMHAFIHLAYQMVALLYETAPSFENTWIECLGDLGRCRMAIEKENQDRGLWAKIASSWYSKAAENDPTAGRLHHHLAIVARPNTFLQVAYFSRSLTCVVLFPSARDSFLAVLDPLLGAPTPPKDLLIEKAFMQAHGFLLKRLDSERFMHVQAIFLSLLDNHIGRAMVGWKEQGVHIAVTNIAGLFDYGLENSVLRSAFLSYASSLSDSRGSRPPFSLKNPTSPIIIEADTLSRPGVLALGSDFTSSAAYLLTKSTLILALRRKGDENVLPHVLVLLSFLSSCASIPHVALLVDHAPWREIVTFLNSLAGTGSPMELFTGSIFPSEEACELPLPEDYFVRGQLWSLSHFPKSWFSRTPDEEERYLELASTSKLRAERILRIGYYLSTVS